MAYALSFAGVLVFSMVCFLIAGWARREHGALIVSNPGYTDWFFEALPRVSSYKPAAVRAIRVMVVVLWLAGVVLAAVYEGVAYTLLVFTMGWLLAIPLAILLVALLALLVFVMSLWVFALCWLGFLVFGRWKA